MVLTFLSARLLASDQYGVIRWCSMLNLLKNTLKLLLLNGGRFFIFLDTPNISKISLNFFVTVWASNDEITSTIGHLMV